MAKKTMYILPPWDRRFRGQFDKNLVLLHPPRTLSMHNSDNKDTIPPLTGNPLEPEEVMRLNFRPLQGIPESHNQAPESIDQQCPHNT